MEVAVIGGGGAGLACAWLLEETHQVTLFEKSDRLGGHLETVSVEVGGERRTVDAGVHMLSESLQPTLVRFLRLLGAPFAPYQSTVTFFDRRDGFTLYLPPFGSLARLSGLVRPRSLRALAAMRNLIEHAVDLVEKEGGFSIRLEEYIDRVRLPEPLCREFLYPFLSSFWGVLPDEVRTFSAKGVLCYPVLHRPGLIRPQHNLRMIGGTRVYVERLVAGLGRTRIERRAPIATIEKRDRWVVAGREFDQVVIATDAAQAAAIIGAGNAIGRLLRTIEYSETTIAVHGDVRFMPGGRAGWSTVNAIFDGRSCAITSWEIDNRGVDLFRSWITRADRQPEKCYATRKYLHPRPSPAYFAAQAALEPHQGKQGLWLAGMYAAGCDNHEGALLSALRVARSLAPDAPRVKPLLVPLSR
jgi:predicted NAD/FAD-binding protein